MAFTPQGGGEGNAEAVLQTKNFEESGMIQTSLVIPFDDSPPLITEGASLIVGSIVPNLLTSKIRVKLTVPMIMASEGNAFIVSLYRGSVCIGSCPASPEGAQWRCHVALDIIDTPASQSEVTYSARFGFGNTADSQPATVNGNPFSGAKFGGAAKVTLNLSEIDPAVVTGTGDIVQVKTLSSNTVFSTTADITGGATPPLITEGVEYFSLPITPSNVSNKVNISVNIPTISNNGGNPIVAAVFRGSVCVGVASNVMGSLNVYGAPLMLHVVDAPATTSPVTYSVRIGKHQAGANTLYIHGEAGRKLGGASVSTFILEEVNPTGTGRYVVQEVNAETATQSSTVLTIPYDNTPPLITEGFEVMSQSFTPTSTANGVRVTANLPLLQFNVPDSAIITVFRDSVCIGVEEATTNDALARSLTVDVVDFPATQGAVVYSVRVGSTATTTFVNRWKTNATIYGGAAKASLILTEVFKAPVAALGVVATKFFRYATFTTFTAAIPNDDTVPLVSAGTELFSFTHRPLSSSNKIKFIFSCEFDGPGIAQAVVALFRGSTNIGTMGTVNTGQGYQTTLAFQVEDTPASASEITYSVRIGPGSTNVAGVTLNGQNGIGRKFGGTMGATLQLMETAT